jgi:hypothetical protein
MWRLGWAEDHFPTKGATRRRGRYLYGKYKGQAGLRRRCVGVSVSHATGRLAVFTFP